MGPSRVMRMVSPEPDRQKPEHRSFAAIAEPKPLSAIKMKVDADRRRKRASSIIQSRMGS